MSVFIVDRSTGVEPVVLPGISNSTGVASTETGTERKPPAAHCRSLSCLTSSSAIDLYLAKSVIHYSCFRASRPPQQTQHYSQCALASLLLSWLHPQ